MSRLLSFYRSALGKKAVMAVSGIVLFGFVLIHMLGNLKLYLGAEAINHYGEWLREMGQPLLPRAGALWLMRLGLLAAVVLHLVSALQVTRASWAARPLAYQRRDVVAATYASRTMRWGGVILGLFVLYHLAHFTWGWSWAHPDFVAGDVYHNMVTGFSVWWVSGLYIVANLALGLHLYHGLWSMFQSLGLEGHGTMDGRRRFAQVFALVVTAGNVSFPISVLTGIVSGG